LPKEILAAGFDYIAEKNGIMLFRRPKRFGSIGFKRRPDGLNV